MFAPVPLPSRTAGESYVNIEYESTVPFDLQVRGSCRERGWPGTRLQPVWLPLHSYTRFRASRRRCTSRLCIRALLLLFSFFLTHHSCALPFPLLMQNVHIYIPLPSSAQTPQVNQVRGIPGAPPPSRPRPAPIDP